MRKIILSMIVMAVIVAPNIIFAAAQLRVTGIPSVRGKIMVAVYKNQADLKNKKQYKGFIVDVTENMVTLELAGMEPGWYMIAAYHDANENQDLDCLFFGPPVEAYGFSNNARGFFGPASFGDAKFYYDGKDLMLNIKLGGI